MSDADDAERQLRSELMATQIERLRQEMKWEPYKAFAAIIGGVAAMSGIILAVAHFIK